jgi:hypothetical protein
MKDIKNIIEVLEAIKCAAIPVKEALKDGLDVADLGKALDLIKNYQVFLDAVEGVGEIGEEINDLESPEAIMIASKVFEIVKAIKAS